jgi:hypothetical protein
MGRWFAAAIGGVVTCLGVSIASAEMPRDQFLNPPAAGTFANLDAYTIGVQASLENRAHLEEGMSMLQTRVSAVASYPYADGSLNLDARVFLFTLGGSVGYRHVWRNHTFEDPAADRSREARREREDEGLHDSQGFSYAEARLRLVIPLDLFFLVNNATVRDEGRQDNSFDWLHGNVHDGGTFFKYEATLFLRHRDFGAIGPYLRVMEMPITNRDSGGGHSRDTELHLGIVYATRPGLIRPRGGNSDLFLFQIVTKLNDDEKEYGLHGYYVPAYLLAVYRASIELAGP